MTATQSLLRASAQPLSRRTLLRILWGVGALALLIQIGAIFLDFFRPRKLGTFGSAVPVGMPEQFAVGSITRFVDGKFYLSRVPEGVLALYQKCPHLGCVVPWERAQQTEDKNFWPTDASVPVPEQGRFNCPCHGSIYNRYGVNVAGPAPRPMDLMEVRVEDGVILVDTSKITQRSGFEPSQATTV